MQTVIGRHKVGDFNTWLKGHQDRLDLFSGVGATFQTFQDADNPNSIALIIQTPDLEKLAAMINDPSNAAIKAKHTVIEPVTISLQVPV